MRFNWKPAAAGIVILALFVLFVPQHVRFQTDRPDQRRTKPDGAAELRIKQHILEQDVMLTDKLCRRQCRVTLENMLKQAADQKRLNEGHLQAMRRSHPHIEYVEVYDAVENQKNVHGTLADLPQEVLPYLELARETVKRNRPYESQRIETKKGPYFVTAVTAEDRNSGYALAAVSQHQLLEKVRTEQRKNLRLVPYPSDARFGIQSADSDTLTKVDVDHPEENEGVSHYYKHDVVVSFKTDPDEQTMARLAEELDAEQIHRAGYAYVIRSRTLTAERMMDHIRRNYDVRYVEPHYLYVTNEVSEPNDALYADYQWNLPAIRAELAWPAAYEGEEVIVAVVDTGVDLNHPDLQNRLIEGYNVFTETADAYDDVGHGTHVAGIIAANINNYEGIAGIAPRTRIMPVKVLDETGAGSTYAVAQGIIWATDHGAKVINLSLGNYAEAQFLHDAIRYAYDRDVVLIAATGNDHTETPGYPAAYDEVLAVGATDASRNLASFSNYGDYVDVAAPGVNIASTYPGQQYAAMSGTSMASPHAAALAAMIRSVNSSLTNEQIMELIRSSAVDLGEEGYDIYFGYGEINAAKAVEAAQASSRSVLNWSESLQRDIDKLKSRFE
jgi:type VII secretion-associated serine protease mycosin